MPEEDDNATRPKRSHSSNRCSRCLQYGHNMRKCPLPPKEPDDEPSNPDQAVDENNQALQQF
ncbi:Zinc finger, CCHC-type superfamily [Sesbania bispinosa]|nr:Zinc finger, CCHC-type superfamily [Sesbania bispinosa]